ncbi:MAG: hypothetical protein AAFY84_06190 [Pseudomonadota bacterium]
MKKFTSVLVAGSLSCFCSAMAAVIEYEVTEVANGEEIQEIGDQVDFLTGFQRLQFESTGGVAIDNNGTVYIQTVGDRTSPETPSAILSFGSQGDFQVFDEFTFTSVSGLRLISVNENGQVLVTNREFDTSTGGIQTLVISSPEGNQLALSEESVRVSETTVASLLDSQPEINSAGDVVVFKRDENGISSIILVDQTGPTTIVLETDDPNGFSSFGRPSINDLGEVAFAAAKNDGTIGVFVYKEGNLALRAEAPAGQTFSGSGIKINNNGDVVVARIDEANETSTLVSYDRSGSESIIFESPEDQNIQASGSDFSLNDTGDVLFYGIDSDRLGQSEGVIRYLFIDGQVFNLVDLLSTDLDDRFLENIIFGDEALNNDRSIVFTSVSGIFRADLATVIPLPGAMFLFVFGIAALPFAKRGRRS